MNHRAARLSTPLRPESQRWDGRTGETTVILARPLPRPVPVVEPPTVPIALPASPPVWTLRRVVGLGLFVAVVVLAVLLGYNLAVGQVISPVPVSCVQER